MRLIIPELEGYMGGKSRSGVYQNIINKIPPHKTLAIPFLGNCGVLRNIKWPSKVIASDIDPFVIDSWKKHTQNLPIWLFNEDWFRFICSLFDEEDLVIYLDPPYPWMTRKSTKSYQFEMNDDDHIRLLGELLRFKKAKILINTYENPIYSKMLEYWNKISYLTRTRGSNVTETLYWNFDGPYRLHDYNFFGGNFKEREHFKLKKERLVSKFEAMTELEQGFYLDALQQAMPLNI